MKRHVYVSTAGYLALAPTRFFFRGTAKHLLYVCLDQSVSDPPPAPLQATWLAADSVSKAWIASAPSAPRSFSQTVRSRSRRDTRASALR